MRWLLLRFKAPLASFGDITIDSQGKTRSFPAKSMLVGLFANALGWTRSMSLEHQSLQDRIEFGAMYEENNEAHRLTDYQTAKLEKDDKSWSTRGMPVGRFGGAKTYEGSHQRWRDYLTDINQVCVVRLNPENHCPTMEDLASALEFPARPLFLGRKSCLPSTPIFCGWIEAQNITDALISTIDSDGTKFWATWPASESTENAEQIRTISDERNWVTGLHGGSRRICEGRLIK